VKGSFALAALVLVAGCAGAGGPPRGVNVASRAPDAGVSSATEATGAVDASAPDGIAESEVESDASSAADGGSAADALTSACNEQPPQDFLIRSNYLPKGDVAEIKRRVQLHQDAIRYRTERYGFFRGFGKPEWNAHAPDFYAEDTTFMGKPVRMNKRVTPALKCVEEEIKRACADHPYQPHALAGIRFHNTYHSGEITNHAYGIAIDVDPSLNSCCGCVPPWNSSPLCSRPLKTGYERMSMPECWVHVFERFGFYWLGHDVLQDTMHFEFLGDPEKIVR
jgi:hypothetical protein